MACSREFGGTLGNCPHDGNLLVALPQDAWEGRRLADRYKIDRRLGTGGMGVVYLAWHELMERWVAIKMLKQSFVEDQMSVKRFQQEAKAASRLKHPNVITLHDFGITNTGQPYMVMDYLVGYDDHHPAKSLAQLIKESGQLPVEKCIHILTQACEALDHAHRQGVIHRDIKPANIMIVPTEDDPLFVKVVDFGVAKLLPINNIGEDSQDSQSLTQVGEVCGSPVYMSPEQCGGQALDSRADIYSMGIVLYETLTGKLPLLGKNMVDTMAKHMNEKPPSFNTVRPDLFIPDKLEQVTMRALAKSPHARQQSMSELAQDLQFSVPRAGQTPNLKAHELLPLPEEEETKSANWLLPAIGGGVVALAIAGFVLYYNGQKQPTTAAKPAVVQQPAATPAVAPAQVSPPSGTTTTAATTTEATTTPTRKPAEPVTPVAVTKPIAVAPPQSVTKPVVRAQKPVKKAVASRPRPPAAVSSHSPSTEEARFADLAGDRSTNRR
jgi:serine/threonine-protein kinase